MSGPCSAPQQVWASSRNRLCSMNYHVPILSSYLFSCLSYITTTVKSVQLPSQLDLYSKLFFFCAHCESPWFRSNMWICLCVKELQEHLEARERECVRLRRELKELRNTVSLRRLLTQGEISFSHL